MSLTVAAEPVPLRAEESGAVRVGQTRVLLELVIGAHKEGLSPEEIVEHYTTLSLADVYAVVAYYLRHRDEVEEYLRERERKGEEQRRLWEAHSDPSGTRAKLLARRAQRNGS